MIFSNTKEFKVCFFEAKQPRLSTHRDYWDSLQKSTGESHFSGQVSKQKRVSKHFAVWEMFFCEYPFCEQPDWMQDYISTCVWHRDVKKKVDIRNNSKKWTDRELEDLHIDVNKLYPTGIDHMVREVCLCNEGQLFSGNNYARELSEFELPIREVLVIKSSG